MHNSELSYYIRKMMSIERKVPDKKKLLSNVYWNDYQRKAAKLFSSSKATEDQKRLIFRHV